MKTYNNTTLEYKIFHQILLATSFGHIVIECNDSWENVSIALIKMIKDGTIWTDGYGYFMSNKYHNK